MGYSEAFNKARKSIEFADHMAYITMPVVRENKLIIKMLTELEKALTSIISAILQYEYSYKRISLYKSQDLNLRTFIEKSSKRYNISASELANIKEIFFLAKKHENSEFEFTKSENFVIMSKQNTFSVSLEKIKIYLETAKSLLKKAESIINEKR